MSELALRLALRRGAFELDLELALPARGVVALFGPSGSGKTTVLRCIAGLERATVGRVRLGDALWQDEQRALFVPPHRRPIGYVFQEASLFAHLSVRGNLEYGWRRVPRGERRFAVDEVAERLGLGALLARSPAGLSGGERQRVAIARALLAHPALLLMDEPLASLDEARRGEILPWLEGLRDELGVPIVYVSHSMREVLRLADHMAWIEAGRLRAAGPLQEVLARLELAAGQGDELAAVLEATVEGHEEEWALTLLASAYGPLRVPRLHRERGARVRVQVAARDVSLALVDEPRSTLLNRFEARVVELADAGPGRVLARLAPPGAAGPALLAQITRKSCVHLGLAPGALVQARVKSVGLME